MERITKLKKPKAVTFKLDDNTVTYCAYNYTKEDSMFWMNVAVDQMRFKNRIKEVGNILNHILKSDHREQVYNKRFSS